MKYDLVIFDLDGTLLNTLDDLADAAAQALSEAGLPARSREEIRKSIGGGVKQLIRKVAPAGIDEAGCAALLERFKAIYAANVNVHTLPYPGITELLEALHAAGVRTAINSNKVDAASRALSNAHFGSLIDVVLGERPDIAKKPAPDGAERIMRMLDAAPERTLYVGDSDTDITTALNAGVDSAWVSWGYRTLDELADLEISYRFDTAEALRDFILGA